MSTGYFITQNELEESLKQEYKKKSSEEIQKEYENDDYVYCMILCGFIDLRSMKDPTKVDIPSVIRILKKNPIPILFMDQIRENRAWMKQITKQVPSVLAFREKEIGRSSSILKHCKEYPYLVVNLSSKLSKDLSLIKKIIRCNPKVLDYATSELLSNTKIFLYAFEKIRPSLSYFSVLLTKKLILQLIEIEPNDAIEFIYHRRNSEIEEWIQEMDIIEALNDSNYIRFNTRMSDAGKYILQYANQAYSLQNN